MTSSTSLRGRLPSVWAELCRCKRVYYSSLAHYNIALALLELSSVADTQLRVRLVHVMINAHSRAAVAAADTLRRPVYGDTAVETPHARLLLGNNRCTSHLLIDAWRLCLYRRWTIKSKPLVFSLPCTVPSVDFISSCDIFIFGNCMGISLNSWRQFSWWCMFYCDSEGSHSTISSEQWRRDKTRDWMPRVGRNANAAAESSWQVERALMYFIIFIFISSTKKSINTITLYFINNMWQTHIKNSELITGN